MAVLALVGVTILSCSHPPRETYEEAADEAVSYALLVEKELSGVVFNKPLSDPAGLAVDGRGFLYVCDRGNNRVLKFDSQYVALDEVGGYGSEENMLSRPSFLTVDDELNLYVSDEGNQRICRYNPQLEFIEAIPFFDEEEPFKFGAPAGVNLTGFGELWVADKERNRIALFTNVGSFDRFIGEFGSPGGQLLRPEKILRARNGDFYVCDAGNSRVVVYDEYGNFRREILVPGSLTYPRAAALAGKRLWVLDQATGKVELFTQSGRKVFETGPLLIGTRQPLSEPSDITLNWSGRLLIADSGNNRVLVCRIITGSSP